MTDNAFPLEHYGWYCAHCGFASTVRYDPDTTGTMDLVMLLTEQHRGLAPSCPNTTADLQTVPRRVMSEATRLERALRS